MKLNKKAPSLVTHEGGTAKHISAAKQLERSMLSCMLWEKEFYESGEGIADRIAKLIPQVDPHTVALLTVYAREKSKLRHIPLFVAREMLKHKDHKPLVSALLATIIQRPDELTEFLSIYWKDDKPGMKSPIAAQAKKGLAKAFNKFSEYQLSKYNQDGAIKLRDVLFLCHAKPKDKEQEEVWKRLVNGTLTTPDTWEVELSASKDKTASWTRLLEEDTLGGLALLRNLRNMGEAKVDRKLIKKALLRMKVDRILPYRFIAAAKFAPDMEQELEAAMFKSLKEMPKFTGSTLLLVDVSGSMDHPVSSKSDLTRLDAACGLAMLARELCDDLVIKTFSTNLVSVPSRRGFGLAEAIVKSQPHSSTYLGKAVNFLNKAEAKHDRIIIITDEQSKDKVPDPVWKNAYVINVASAKNGVGYGTYNHIDGWSEAVLSYIQGFEQ